MATSIFDAAVKYLLENPQFLTYPGELSDPKVKRMVERLARSAVDPKVRREIDAELEIDRTINRLLDEREREHQAALQAKDAAIDLAIKAQEQRIAELKKQIEEKKTSKSL
jgi:hypothetical protein